MKLYHVGWSPFARKVRIAAIERGIASQIELIEVNIGFAEKTLKIIDNDIINYNPSGRVPTLITDSGEAVYDSTVIVHYLDSIGSAPPIIPNSTKDKIQALKLDALVQEVLDSLRFTNIENKRKKEERLPDYINALDEKVKRGLAVLEEEVVNYTSSRSDNIDLGEISIATLIGTIKRNPNSKYNIKRTNIDKWFDKLQLRDSLIQTKPQTL
jgi:glutathione S-transferase